MTGRLTEMHARHGSQRVDDLSLHPDTFRVVMADRIEEAVLLRQEAGWHCWVKDKGSKGKEIRQSESSSNDSKNRVVRGDIVIPRNKSGNRSARVSSIVNLETYPTVPGMWINA